MKQLKFYDLKGKKSFMSGSYKIVDKNVKGKKRKFAVATAKGGNECWKML